MCGIVGLYLKNPALRTRLGSLFSPMLAEMTDRGPDSAGVAVYRPEAAPVTKVTLQHPDPTTDWDAVAAAMGTALGAPVAVERNGGHAILRIDGAASPRPWLRAQHPELRVTSSGTVLEIYKAVGTPDSVLARFGVPQMTGSHAVGHTRMATESAVTTEGAHPFNTGDDLCLVHNGSLSNHNRLRARLRREGIDIETENDTEVAAGYLTWRLHQGASITQALEAALAELDGFYTFAVGTKDGFSVLRDPIACKPAVMAETDDWVAMATEYRALARLPGVDAATVWEPAPATVYSWGTA